MEKLNIDIYSEIFTEFGWWQLKTCLRCLGLLGEFGLNIYKILGKNRMTATGLFG